MEIANIVEDIVNQNVWKNKLFTAFDVTREVRNRVGRSVQVPHEDVKQIVNEMFSNGKMDSYTRTIADFLAFNPQPFIYHNINDSYTNYTLQEEEEVVASVCRTDARGTLCVPSILLRNAGLNPYDIVSVTTDALNGSLIISKITQNPLTTYTVDEYGNVRITQGILVKAGMGGDEYNITGDTDKITVTKSTVVLPRYITG